MRGSAMTAINGGKCLKTDTAAPADFSAWAKKHCDHPISEELGASTGIARRARFRTDSIAKAAWFAIWGDSHLSVQFLAVNF